MQSRAPKRTQPITQEWNYHKLKQKQSFKSRQQTNSPLLVLVQGSASQPMSETFGPKSNAYDQCHEWSANVRLTLTDVRLMEMD